MRHKIKAVKAVVATEFLNEGNPVAVSASENWK